ncbi:MAG: Vitamin K epoxide reductase [Candidatus Jorgensenbacteria bacterium GW2011_GWF2_41_8]|uniref:Vitamin K epoxide reductase n=1 Tax=Candidatus Jorgensenbacteria bacterium GW2011_GWF2_41_8 TaxID=1618667 RepID=A0A0G0XJJ9_9BACT|nr:MAG: Vitamin K epoxide reductase [Candidatus Jorgensenbacteria bacterium GW2011_GWF2_41_8]
MTNSKTSSTRPSKIIPNWVIFALIAVSLIGLADSSYLAAKHYLGSPINCSIFNGCEVVTTSPYSVILGVPVALFGVLYYFSFLLLTILYLDSKKIFNRRRCRFHMVFIFADIYNKSALPLLFNLHDHISDSFCFGTYRFKKKKCQLLPG